MGVVCILDTSGFLDPFDVRLLRGMMIFRILGIGSWKWAMVIGIGGWVMVDIEGR